MINSLERIRIQSTCVDVSKERPPGPALQISSQNRNKVCALYHYEICKRRLCPVTASRGLHNSYNREGCSRDKTGNAQYNIYLKVAHVTVTSASVSVGCYAQQWLPYICPLSHYESFHAVCKGFLSFHLYCVALTFSIRRLADSIGNYLAVLWSIYTCRIPCHYYVIILSVSMLS